MDKYQANMDDREDSAHLRIINQCKLGIIEIGVLYGDLSAFFCKNTTIPVYGIDPIIPDSMNLNLVGSIETIMNRTKDYPNYIFINNYSWNVVGTFNSPFDYIFFDGDHQYESVKRDFEEWLPKLPIGGFLSFHDSAMYRGGANYWPGPSKVADECLNDARLEFIESVYSLTAFKKIRE